MPRTRGKGVHELLLLRCANGANIGTGAAVDALIFVDHKDAVAFRNAFLGAFANADAAADASIRNLISHNPNLLYSRSCVLWAIIDHLQKFCKG
jgi:hypothetical protein